MTYVVGDEFIVASVASGGAGSHADQGSTRQQVVDGTLLNGARVVVRLVEEDGVGDGRLQWS